MDSAQFNEFMTSFKDAMKKLAPTPASTAPSSVSIHPSSNFENFNIELESFHQYVERFENFCKLKQITDTQVKKLTLLNSIGPVLYERTKCLVAPKSIEETTFKDVVDTLKATLSPTPNKLVSQHRLLCRVQGTENLSEYVTELQKLVSECKFNCTCGKSVSDLLLIAQFIRGIKDNSIREKLLQEDSSDFKTILQKAFAYEASKIDANEVGQSTSSSSSAASATHHISRSKHHSNSNQFSRNQSMSRKRSVSHSRTSRSKLNYSDLGINDVCVRCGRNNHLSRDCRVNPSKLKCNSCHKKGHVSKVCISTLIKNKQRSLSTSRVSNLSDESDGSYTDFQSTYDIKHMSICKTVVVDLFNTDVSTDKYEIEVLIAGKKVTFEVDSGSGYTLLPSSKFRKLNIQNQMKPASVKFRTYDAGIVVPEGMLEVPVTYKGIESQELLFIVPDGHSPLLGRSWIRHLNINLQDIDNNNSSSSNFQEIHKIKTIDEFEKLFPNVFQQSVETLSMRKCQ
uniref:CCHC-type domain-containing protein n=1 Tax=Cacopsylla melanoneura TaxID=428564 RepID=A0A8D8RVU1_9HEMI